MFPLLILNKKMSERSLLHSSKPPPPPFKGGIDLIKNPKKVGWKNCLLKGREGFCRKEGDAVSLGIFF